MATCCLVFGCSKPTVSRGLCDTHRKRLERHGDVQHSGRAADWGKREKHPAYAAWCNLRRYHRFAIPAAWYSDFWTFARDVPSKPEGRCSAQRPDPEAPWGPGNFFWKEPALPEEVRRDRATYMREWQRQRRDANAEYYRDAKLKQLYGVEAGWYGKQMALQNGVCAICEQPETKRIRGREVALAVDHCHSTGVVRGLLCMKCNRAIGLLDHNPKLLRHAIAYLEDK